MPIPRRLFTGCPVRLALLLGAVAGLLFTAPARGQDSPPLSVKVKSVEVGFQLYGQGRSSSFKPGLWAPVHVVLEQTNEGAQLSLPVGKDEFAHGKLAVGVNDSDDVQATYHTDFDMRKSDESVVIQSYANPATLTPQFQLTLEAGNNRYSQSVEVMSNLELNYHLYLTVGNRVPALNDALITLSAKPQENNPAPRFAGYETELERLPTEWFGYQSVDLLVLLTDNRDFMKGLASDESKAHRVALADWVRRGGRLVVSVSPANQDYLQKILQKWQPALPTLLTGEQLPLSTMVGVSNWAEATEVFPASRENPMIVAKLKTSPAMEVLLREDRVVEHPPLIVRVPYGRGSVTLLAFPVDRTPFVSWNGRVAFWKNLVLRLAPRVRPTDANNLNPAPFGRPGGRRGGFGDGSSNFDVTTQFHQELDQFDVPKISFVWVALFILIFILIVGPLDFVLLFYVVRRPEWTWITFPVVVISVTVIAYFTAYALKGNDLKINKVDLVDIDMRTTLDRNNKPAAAYAYGTTWFAILSPRIQDYTIGLEPKLEAWSAKNENQAAPGRVMMTWMGRAEAFGAGGIGRQRSASLFRRVYDYAPDATGLTQVPIPVWTTKAFWASWEARFGELPLEVNLSYRVSDPDQKVTGTIRNNLPVTLKECYLVYGDKFYPVVPLPGREPDGKAAAVAVQLEPHQATGIDHWVQNLAQRPGRTYEDRQSNYFAPESIIKRFYFYDRNFGTGGDLNHVQRLLDQSWRIQDLKAGGDEVRTAILVGKLDRAEGPARDLTESKDPRLPSHLWLGNLPGNGDNQIMGSLIQETYVRVFVPVRPEQK